MKTSTTKRSPLGSDNRSPSLAWRPLTEEPTERCGWYAAAVNPVNAAELDAAGINSWREKFGFTKVWYNKPGKSSQGTWWEPDPHGQRSQPIGHRMTHWAELPPVPLIPKNVKVHTPLPAAASDETEVKP